MWVNSRLSLLCVQFKHDNHAFLIRKSCHPFIENLWNQWKGVSPFLVMPITQTLTLNITNLPTTALVCAVKVDRPTYLHIGRDNYIIFLSRKGKAIWQPLLSEMRCKTIHFQLTAPASVWANLDIRPLISKPIRSSLLWSESIKQKLLKRWNATLLNRGGNSPDSLAVKISLHPAFCAFP